jgi:hypothetical protein
MLRWHGESLWGTGGGTYVTVGEKWPTSDHVSPAQRHDIGVGWGRFASRGLGVRVPLAPPRSLVGKPLPDGCKVGGVRHPGRRVGLRGDAVRLAVVDQSGRRGSAEPQGGAHVVEGVDLQARDQGGEERLADRDRAGCGCVWQAGRAARRGPRRVASSRSRAPLRSVTRDSVRSYCAAPIRSVAWASVSSCMTIRTDARIRSTPSPVRNASSSSDTVPLPGDAPSPPRRMGRWPPLTPPGRRPRRAARAGTLPTPPRSGCARPSGRRSRWPVRGRSATGRRGRRTTRSRRRGCLR